MIPAKGMKDDRTANRLDGDGAATRTVDSLGLWADGRRAPRGRRSPASGSGLQLGPEGSQHLASFRPGLQFVPAPNEFVGTVHCHSDVLGCMCDDAFIAAVATGSIRQLQIFAPLLDGMLQLEVSPHSLCLQYVVKCLLNLLPVVSSR